MTKNYLKYFPLLFILSLTLPNQLIFKDKIKEKIGKDSLNVSKQISNLNKIDSSEIKGERIIANYVSAIGGKSTINKIMDRTTYITGKVHSMNIHIVVYQKIPNKYFQKINLGAAEQKIIFDGRKGITITGDNEQEISGLDLEKLKYDATMQLLLYLRAYDVKAEFAGKEKVKSKNVYKVILKLPDNMEWVQYYDTATYLKIKEIKPINSPKGKAVDQTTFFTNYKEVGGVKYPFGINQTLGTSVFIFHVDSIKVNTGLSDRNFEIE